MHLASRGLTGFACFVSPSRTSPPGESSSTERAHRKGRKIDQVLNENTPQKSIVGGSCYGIEQPLFRDGGISGSGAARTKENPVPHGSSLSLCMLGDRARLRPSTAFRLPKFFAAAALGLPGVVRLATRDGLILYLFCQICRRSGAGTAARSER